MLIILRYLLRYERFTFEKKSANFTTSLSLMFSYLLAKCLLLSVRRYVIPLHKRASYMTENNNSSNNRKMFCIMNVRMFKSKKQLQTSEFAVDALKFMAQNFKSIKKYT